MNRLFLISNSKLSPALHIYEKYGFTEVKLANYAEKFKVAINE